jgi:tripartite-type tricarboxylate transporter receptor subunit TctC
MQAQRRIDNRRSTYMQRSKRFLLAAGAAGLLTAALGLAPNSAHAQAYPTKEIRFICAVPAGSGADVLVRFFEKKIHEVSGKTIITENKAGAAGLVATKYVANAKPDGYTIFVHAGSAVANIPALYKDPGIDVAKALEVVGTINRQPFMIVVDAKSPYKTLADLTEAMKKKGDKASYAYAATTGQVMGEIYKVRAGLKAVGVRYGTATESLNDQLSGRVDFGAHDPVYSLAEERKGTLRILGVSTDTRLDANPEMKTMKEQGIDMDLTGWWAAMVPAGTPKAVKDTLNGWFVKAMQDPETKKFLNSFGGDPLMESPEAAQKRLLKDIADWKEYVKLAHIEPQ